MKLDYYIRYLQEFINSDRTICYVPTANSWHRRQIHEYCDKFHLSHETVERGMRKRFVCPGGASHSVRIDESPIDDQEIRFECADCNFRDTRSKGKGGEGLLYDLYRKELPFLWIKVEK